MNFQPTDTWPGAHYFGYMGKPQTNPGAGWQRRLTTLCSKWLYHLFGGLATADDPLTVTFRDVDPPPRIPVDFLRATARIVAC